MSRMTKDNAALQEIWASMTKEDTRLLLGRWSSAAGMARRWDHSVLARSGEPVTVSRKKKGKQIKAGSKPRLSTDRSWHCQPTHLPSSKLGVQTKHQQMSPGSDGWTGRCAKKGRNARQQRIVQKKFYQEWQHLDCPTPWFTTVEANRRQSVMGNPDVLTSVLCASRNSTQEPNAWQTQC